MAENTKDHVSVLNDLISVCKDAEEGFRGAADAVQDPVLKNTFERYSKQRAGFVRELQAEVKRLGENPDNPIGVAGKLHGGWMGLKAALTGHDAHQVLVETESGEDMAVQHYRDALGKSVPAPVRSIIESQYEQIQQAHSHIRNARDAAARAGKAAAEATR